MELAKVTSKGQVTIPLSIRNFLNLRTGDKLFFFEEKGKVFVQNASLSTDQSIAVSELNSWTEQCFQNRDTFSIL